MKLEDVKALTDEELRIKVAEMEPQHTWLAKATPNYPRDLNACHEMEKALHCTQLGKYMRLLSDRERLRETDPDWSNVARDDWACCTATARQRCEAFVLTGEARRKETP